MIHRMNLAALFFMAVLLLTGCTNKEKTDFSKYITGYTSGVIKSSSSLSVYLGQPSDKGFQAGSTLPADLFRISPAIKGLRPHGAARRNALRAFEGLRGGGEGHPAT